MSKFKIGDLVVVRCHINEKLLNQIGVIGRRPYIKDGLIKYGVCFNDHYNEFSSAGLYWIKERDLDFATPTLDIHDPVYVYSRDVYGVINEIERSTVDDSVKYGVYIEDSGIVECLADDIKPISKHEYTKIMLNKQYGRGGFIFTDAPHHLPFKAMVMPKAYKSKDCILPGIKKIIFNNPATIILWADGTKTVVKCAGDTFYDEYAGFCSAVCKKIFGSNSEIKRLLNSEFVTFEEV